MTEPMANPVEVSPEELGQRLAQMRLVPATDAMMEASLRRYGQLSPLVAFRDKKLRLEVIDGFRRLRAARMQGHPALLVVRVLDVDEACALAALFALHRGGAALTELEEGWVVQALVREHGMAQAQAAQLLRRHQSWVSRRLLLVEALAPEVQTDVRLGLCSPTAAREVARLPRGIQRSVAQVMARQGMSTRAAAKLVADALRLRPTTTEEIERLCQSAQVTVPSRAGVRGEADAYAADFAVLERVAVRLRGRLVEHFGGVPRAIRYDHQKAVVARHEGPDVIYQPRLLAFATHYGFEPRAVRPGKPNDKAFVERDLWDFERSFLNGRRFRDLEDMREQARRWLADIVDQRAHPKLRQQRIAEIFATCERAALLPLPTHPFDTARVVYRLCSIDGFVMSPSNQPK